jgi:hypothetical protein
LYLAVTCFGELGTFDDCLASSINRRAMLFLCIDLARAILYKVQLLFRF